MQTTGRTGKRAAFLSDLQSNYLHNYSHRLSWSIAQNSLTRLLEEKRRAGVPVLDLTVSNPTGVPEYPDANIRAALSGIETFSYRPDSFGLAEAREAVAQFYRERRIDVAATRIALTASTSEAYAVLFKLLCDPGDEILIPSPSYPLFEYLAALENVGTVPYRLEYDGSWFIDFASVQERISTRSRAIVIVNPNNPTGSFLKSHELRKLVELASEKRIAIISDEVFMDYEFGSAPQRIKTLAREDGTLSFSLNGFSKAAGMPQMKLAWITINGPKYEQKLAIERLEIVLDTYLSVNTPVQMAASALLDIGAGIRSKLLARSLENRDRACRLAKNSPVHLLHVEGGWSSILRLPQTLKEEQWISQVLEQTNVYLQPGYFFDMPSEAYAVASLITEPKIFEEGIARVLQFVASRC
jgi:alanine-synthesizing transaminase